VRDRERNRERRERERTSERKSCVRERMGRRKGDPIKGGTGEDSLERGMNCKRTITNKRGKKGETRQTKQGEGRGDCAYGCGG